MLNCVSHHIFNVNIMGKVSLIKVGYAIYLPQNLFFYPRYVDLIDEKSLISRPLVDNKEKDSYLYEILTFTGHWKESSCNSKVYFTITGDEDSTEVRMLDPGWMDTLKKGTADSYVMKTPRPLGNMNYLRIWHDNSGRYNYASWYLSAMIVRDIQTNEVFEFICNKWLAQEKGDQQVPN